MFTWILFYRLSHVQAIVDLDAVPIITKLLRESRDPDAQDSVKQWTCEANLSAPLCELGPLLKSDIYTCAHAHRHPHPHLHAK